MDKITKKFTYNSKAKKLYRPGNGHSASGKGNGEMNFCSSWPEEIKTSQLHNILCANYCRHNEFSLEFHYSDILINKE